MVPALVYVSAGEVHELSLQLKQVAGSNEVSMNLMIGDAKDETVSYFEGTLNVELGLDIEAKKVESIRLTGGRVSATDRNFTLGEPPFFQAVAIHGQGGYGRSLAGSEQLGEDGTFDASRHVIVFDRGFLDTFGIFGSSQIDLSSEPMTSASDKRGRVELKPMADGDGVRFQVILSLPFDSGRQKFQGNAMVAFEFVGGLEASGIIDFSKSVGGGSKYDDVLGGADPVAELPRMDDVLAGAFGISTLEAPVVPVIATGNSDEEAAQSGGARVRADGKKARQSSGKFREERGRKMATTGDGIQKAGVRERGGLSFWITLFALSIGSFLAYGTISKYYDRPFKFW